MHRRALLTGTAAYDNLDQGWALQILVEPDAVFVLAWNWEAPDGLKNARTLYVTRRALATETRARLRSLHAVQVAALRRDLRVTPLRDLAR